MELEIEGEIKSLADYWQMLRRRKYLIAIPMLVLLIISAVVALILPPVYRSEATVLIEQQHIPSDLVQSTVVSSPEAVALAALTTKLVSLPVPSFALLMLFTLLMRFSYFFFWQHVMLLLLLYTCLLFHF